MKKNKIYWTILILIIVFASYAQIFNGFFQQDEWLSFAYRIVSQEKGLFSVIVDSFIPSVGHYQPLNSLFINILFFAFKINYLPYVVVSIFLHLANVFLVFRLFKKIFSSYSGGLFTALIFGISPTIYQATSWVMADLGIHLSTFFAIISISSLYDFYQNPSKKGIIKSLIFLFISLFFKEISIGIFGLIFLVLFIVRKFNRVKKIDNAKQFGKSNIYIVFTTFAFLLYTGLRIFMIFMPVSYQKDSLFLESQNVSTITYNLLSLPARSIVQSIIPTKMLIQESYGIAQLLPKKIVGEKNTPQYDLLVQKKILETVNVINFMGLIILMYIIYKNSTDRNKKIILLSATFVVLNSPIFALAPERSGRMFLIDSRNLYLISLATSGVVYLFINYLWQKNHIFCRLFLLFYLIINIFFLNQELKVISDAGHVRRDVLSKIYSYYPDLPQKSVILTQSDSSYYGLPENEKILPFQSGLGQTLLVWYYSSENYPTDFYTDRFLWEIRDQGYEEHGNRGFGYFRDLDLLIETVKQYNLPKESVIAFKWISAENKLLDITIEVREKIYGQINK